MNWIFNKNHIIYTLLTILTCKIELFSQNTSISQHLFNEISANNLSNIKMPNDSANYVVVLDSNIKAIELSFPCKKWVLHYTDSLDKIQNKHIFNELNEIVLPESKIINGYCFCTSCSKNFRIIQSNETKTFYISLYQCEGKSNIKFTLNPLPEKRWYEKTWSSGNKIELENLLFYPNKSMFLDESYNELNELYLLLSKQSQLKIVIHGHVNGPNNKNSDEFQILSENRAKAVYDYLIKKGINPDRISHKGFGNTQMIFPNAQTELEMKKNRRVEIIIL